MSERNEAEELLTGSGVNLSTIREATVFSDGSMTILHGVEGKMACLVLEHDPHLGAATVDYLRTNGVAVIEE